MAEVLTHRLASLVLCVLLHIYRSLCLNAAISQHVYAPALKYDLALVFVRAEP